MKQKPKGTQRSQKPQKTQKPQRPQSSHGLATAISTPWLKFIPPVACAVALIIAGICLTVLEDEYLWKAQELNLHLDTSLFFRQQLVVPGGLLTWMGTWFTEFFYYPAIGTTWLCLWWALLMVLVAKAFHIPMKWQLLLLVPVAMLLLTCVELGYWIYYLKLRGHFFVATIGLCLTCAAVWLYRLLPDSRFARPLFIAVATAILYPCTGFYALLAALLMGIMAWRLHRAKVADKTADTIVAALSIVAIPLIYYRTVFYQTSTETIYWTALPVFQVSKVTPGYYIPYIVATLFFVTMAATYGKLNDGDVKRPVRWGLCQLVLLVALIVGVQHFWYRDYNFHKELRMQRCMEKSDWNGILAEAAQLDDEPTRAMVMMKNLALFRLGIQGDKMCHYRTGAKPCNAVVPVNMTQVVGRSIYFYYGMPNYCYRWCLEDGVEYGWRAEYLKYMIRSALVNGENRVARKYIDLLKHTRYHGEWAEKQEKFIGNKKAILADEDYKPVIRLMSFKDNLNSDQAIIEQYLMHHFVYDQSNDTLYKEQALLAALWMKDIQIFWHHFFPYAECHMDQHMPTHFQEAAYLYGQLEHEVDISRMPFDESVKKSYEDFMQMARRYEGMSEQDMKELFYPQFGHTFYYDYFLIRNQKLY